MENHVPNNTVPNTPQAPISQNQMKKNDGKIIIFIIVFLIILIGGFATYLFLSRPTTSNMTNQTNTTLPSTDNTSSPNNEWRTYDGSDYSYQYPSAWTLGEEGKALYNLMSPNFQPSPFKGSIISIGLLFIKDPNDTMENTKKELDANKIAYTSTTISGNSAIQYDEVFSADNEQRQDKLDYKTTTLFYLKDKKVQLIYAYEKDHKEDNLQTYIRFLTSFRLK